MMSFSVKMMIIVMLMMMMMMTTAMTTCSDAKMPCISRSRTNQPWSGTKRACKAEVKHQIKAET